MGGAIHIDAARALLAQLEADVPSARTRADAAGDARDLARLIELAMMSVPDSRALADPGARREIAAIDPALGRALERFFRAPLAREASVRAASARAGGEIAKRRVTIAALMRAYRSHDENERAAVGGELDRALGEWLGAGAEDVAAAYAEQEAAPAAAPIARPVLSDSMSSGGLIVAPSADLIQALAGGTLDPALLLGLSQEAQASHAGSSSGRIEPAASAGEPVPPETWRELLAAIAASVWGARPQTFGEWRAACAAFHVADFRFGALGGLGSPRGRELPFEQPGVPISRSGAWAEPDRDAWSTSAALLGMGAAIAGENTFGAALMLSAMTRPFVMYLLRDRPNDPLRAARSLALCSAFRFAVAARADGDAETIRAAYSDLLGASPRLAVARTFAVECAFARAPGERSALYAHNSALSSACLRGLHLARTLRDNFDEDWFRNPRLTRERLSDLALLSAESSESDLIAWLTEHAKL